MHFYLENSSSVVITIESSLYSANVLYKSLYWYGDKYDCSISKEGEKWIITVILKEGVFDDESIKFFISKFKNDLIDFKTREIISAETKNIREILLVKAFAFSDEFDEEAPGEVEDPVGFDVKQF